MGTVGHPMYWKLTSEFKLYDAAETERENS